MMRFMPIVEVIRLEESQQGTFGVLRLNKAVRCLTLEPPDRENVADVSSIPAQQYVCSRVQSPRFGETFQIMDVPGRTRVLFHSGNTESDTSGCIILGTAYGMLGDERAVLSSREAFNAFMAMMDGRDDFHLTIFERH